MNSLGLDSQDLAAMYPKAKSSLEKLTESLYQEHQGLLASRREMLAEIGSNHPVPYQLMIDCLRFDPAERYSCLTKVVEPLRAGRALTAS